MRRYTGDINDRSKIRKLSGAHIGECNDVYITSSGEIVKYNSKTNIGSIIRPLISANNAYMPVVVQFTDTRAKTRLDYIVATLYEISKNDDDDVIKHINGDNLDCNVNNLTWTVKSDSNDSRNQKIKCVETGQIFKNQKEAARYFGVSEGHISGVVSHKWNVKAVRKQYHLVRVDN